MSEAKKGLEKELKKKRANLKGFVTEFLLAVFVCANSDRWEGEAWITQEVVMLPPVHRMALQH